jgi:hypothetical protein
MNAPVAKPETAIAVIDPKSYAAWDPLLDLFDRSAPKPRCCASKARPTTTPLSG